MKSYMNWSGGKDSSLSLYKTLREDKYSVGCLLTNISADHNRISMHGVRRKLLEIQAQALGIPLQTIELPDQPTMTAYENAVRQKVTELKNAGYRAAIFGDIFLEDLKAYREQQMAAENIQSMFPLWKMDTRQLITDFVQLGFKAIIVCVNELYLDRSFCGRIIDHDFLNELPSNVDPCGENGEYHSFVYDGPLFNEAVPFEKGAIERKVYSAPARDPDTSESLNNQSENGFYLCDLLST